MCLMLHSGIMLRRVGAMPWERGHSADVGKLVQVTDFSADTTPSRAETCRDLELDVGASDQLQSEERR